jgi:hypothetical protein
MKIGAFCCLDLFDLKVYFKKAKKTAAMMNKKATM